jgi:hypothetical protein
MPAGLKNTRGICILDKGIHKSGFWAAAAEAAVKKELLPFYARQWNHLSAPSGTDDRKGELT